MFKLSLFLLLGCLMNSVHAQQKVPVQEGTEVTATVSFEALNRIAIQDDKIVMVKSITGQFEFDKDAESGQIFLKPIATDKEQLIHLFIITEKGYTYPLSLVVESGTAKSILLMPIEEQKRVQWEQSNSYETLMRTLVQAMVNHVPIEGFAIENNKNTKDPLPKIKETNITLLHTYVGNKLQGQVLEVINTGREELILTEQQFYQPGVRAVAITNPHLPSKHKTTVCVVR